MKLRPGEFLLRFSASLCVSQVGELRLPCASSTMSYSIGAQHRLLVAGEGLYQVQADEGGPRLFRIVSTEASSIAAASEGVAAGRDGEFILSRAVGGRVRLERWDATCTHVMSEYVGEADWALAQFGISENGKTRAAELVCIYVTDNGGVACAFDYVSGTRRYAKPIALAGSARPRLAIVGDCTGDEIFDYAVSDPGGRSGAGVVNVLSGATGDPVRQLVGPLAPHYSYGAIVGAGVLDAKGSQVILIGFTDRASGMPRVAIVRTDPAQAMAIGVLSGSASGFMDGYIDTIIMVPDLDGDGFNDLVVGWGESNANARDAGEVQCLSGATGATIARVCGQTPGGYFGKGLAGLGTSRWVLVQSKSSVAVMRLPQLCY